ncbi:hypothetical protein CIK05_03945 [Bdellovibrio sp. qaytius]|nr:hypothetical protein CIK05_03945 [Bdellovibrio sp. qaytius]
MSNASLVNSNASLAISQASLAIYLGESYAEIEARSGSTVLLKKTFFLPQTSLKSILNQHIKPLTTEHTFSSVYVVTKYLDRLKSFRLGGSVIQVLNENQENNYTFEDSTCLSLAAAALIIPLNKTFTIDHLKTELERVKKTNAEANKVVISLSQFTDEQLASIENFFIEQKFSVFKNPEPENLNSLRRTLINAGSEGTKEEIVSEITACLSRDDKAPEIHFWVKNKFQKAFENIDLYFSADQFLHTLFFNNKKDLLIHTDLERWIVMKNKTVPVWKSPWGNVNYEHIESESIGIHPFSEVKIHSSGHLVFSKVPAAIEPGPMLAGRSVKTLVVDAFYKTISKDDNLVQLFPKLAENTLCTKIESQFKVLEKGQAHYEEPFDLKIIQDFVVNKLGYDILLHKVKEDRLAWTGHLNILFKKLDNAVSPFSWTAEIFKRI